LANSNARGGARVASVARQAPGAAANLPPPRSLRRMLATPARDRGSDPPRASARHDKLTLT
jgi:hypothetical protein